MMKDSDTTQTTAQADTTENKPTPTRAAAPSPAPKSKKMGKVQVIMTRSEVEAFLSFMKDKELPDTSPVKRIHEQVQELYAPFKPAPPPKKKKARRGKRKKKNPAPVATGQQQSNASV